MPQESFRIRQIHNHHKENEFALKIRGLRSQDFGEYECNVYSNRTRTQRSAALNVTGIKQYHQSKLVTYMFDKLKRYKGNHCILRIDFSNRAVKKWLNLILISKVNFFIVKNHLNLSESF